MDIGCAPSTLDFVLGGGNAEYVTVDCRHVMKVPKSLSMLEAGGVPEVWLTAYQLLHTVG